MKKHLKEILDDDYKFFFYKNEFKIIECRYESEYFGNELLIIEYYEVLVRFLIDRGRFDIQFSSTNDRINWFDIDIVMKLLNTNLDQDISKKIRYKVYANIVREKISEILRIFSKEEYPDTKLRLEKIEVERAEKIFRLG